MKNHDFDEGHYTLRSGITIYPSQDKAIDQLITGLIQKVPAHFVLLVDVTGQVILAKGEQGKIDLVALGSLVAGDLAASQEIARLTGEYQDYQMVLREGHTMHTFIVEAGIHLALLVQISNDVPLGWARMLIQQAAQQLADLLSEPVVKTGQLDTSALLSAAFGEEELSDLFSDALDELWSE
jgi:predicted regulator of Ras-like GTPase activity (Roadblock/LC7/MglB family)